MRADAVRNRRRVLDAARDALGQSGVTASLADVARAAEAAAGADLLARALGAGELRADTEIDDGLDLAAAIT